MNTLLDIYIDSYEGPLDLLIHLIHKNEMNIFDVPISEITDHFVAEIKRMQGLDMEVAAEFIYMASYLIYLKSRSLLPVEAALPGDVPLEEEGFNFTQAIIELAYCKDLAAMLTGHFEKEKTKLCRQGGLLIPAEEIKENPFSLSDAFFNVIYREPERKVVVESTREQVEHVNARLEGFVLSKENTLWSEIVKVFPLSFDKAVAFGSVLSLAREQLVYCVQESNFTEILIRNLRESRELKS